jgi:hypothetical protein
VKIYSPSTSSHLSSIVSNGFNKNIEAENVELNQLSQDRKQNPLERKRALKKTQGQQRPHPWNSQQ